MFQFKKLSYKSWILTLTYSLLTILFFNSTFLYITDTYSIANTKPKQCFSVPNQKYLNTTYILNNKEKYDTFIFGSSRVKSINPFLMQNKKAYNMTYGEGIPHEHLIILKLFINNDVSIKHLLIGLDDFSCEISFKNHQHSFIPKSHYLATNQPIVDFYQFYFFRKPRMNDIIHFKRKYLNYPYDQERINSACVAIFNQDLLYSPSKTSNIKLEETTQSKYILNTQNIENSAILDTKYLKETIRDIDEIITLAKKNNITLLFFINPIKNSTYNYVDKVLFTKFKEKLSVRTSYYDFSIPNIISNDARYWSDGLHYFPEVGDMILNRIYDNNTGIKDFGIYIEKKEKN